MNKFFHIRLFLLIVSFSTGLSFEIYAQSIESDSIAKFTNHSECYINDPKNDSLNFLRIFLENAVKAESLYDPKTLTDHKSGDYLKEGFIRNKQELIDPKRKK